MNSTSAPLRVMLWHWGRRGGGPRYTLELTRALSKRQDLQIYLSLSRQSELYVKFSEITVAGRFDIDTYTSKAGFVLSTLGLPLLKFRFGSFLRSAGIDIVLCTMDHLWDSFVIGSVHQADALYMLTVHDATRHPGEDQRLRQWLLKRDIDASDGAIVLTESVRDKLIETYGYPRERTFLSALGKFSYGCRDTPRTLPTDRPPRLLFFGRIIAYKGLDLLLSALPLLRQEFPHVSLEIWGGGDLSPYRSQLAGLNDVLIENRWIGEEEILEIFERNDLAILPYREASQSAVVATAFSTGMPCIATPIPGLCEQVADKITGLIAEDMEPVSLAHAIITILKDRELYNRLSAGCLHAANTSLNWDTISASVAEDLFQLHSQGMRNNRKISQKI